MKTGNFIISEQIKRVRAIMGLNEGTDDRISAAELVQSTTDNVDTLLKLMSKYQPKDYWYVTVGYLNNVNDMAVTVNPSKDLEDLALSTDNEYIKGLVSSDEWKSGKMKHPHARKTVKKEKIPSTIYKMKTLGCQWLSQKARNKMKADKDSEIMAAYKKRGLPPIKVKNDDKHGLDWENIPGTPFDKHIKTKTKRFVVYRKANCYADSPSVYFIKIGDTIQKISDKEMYFFMKMSSKDTEEKMPKRLMDIEDVELRNEVYAIENLYEFKNLDLEKIPLINCSCVVDGKPVKISYINKNSAPDGVNPGDFANFIQDFVDERL